MKLYFCWERNFKGAWSPVVYHGEMPRRNCKDLEPERTTPILVQDKFISGDTPIFGALVKAHPAPAVVG